MAETKTPFEYKSGKTPPAKQPKKTLSWTASEYIDHQRGMSWYLLLAIATAVLAGGIYLLTKDLMALATVVILGAVVGSVAHWKPRQIKYELSAAGLKVEDKFYPLSHFKTFSIIKEADLVSLVLNPIKRFMPPISAFVDEVDESKIIEIIGDHLPLEEAVMDRIDRLSRRLRF